MSYYKTFKDDFLIKVITCGEYTQQNIDDAIAEAKRRGLNVDGYLKYAHPADGQGKDLFSIKGFKLPSSPWQAVSMALVIVGIFKIFMVYPGLGLVLFALGAGVAWAFIEDKAKSKPAGAVVCPYCGSKNIQIVNETHIKKRGCLGNLIHFMIFFFVWWIWIFVWLFTGKKTVNKTKAVCLDCGKQWYI
ncbi:MAG: hypothetical protein BWY15_01861 [Firmicutes bacterium ADurb.Bin193]|nr:MAG: hypothetical protein BWY15_01861 [Firmicutes bacterium ADurb.Bin193]